MNNPEIKVLCDRMKRLVNALDAAAAAGQGEAARETVDRLLHHCCKAYAALGPSGTPAPVKEADFGIY